ncbi:MAG: hypothetical protein E7016_02690 [Alphaproteobacteria bacterium]|nr:hypothetical protein [Alphaproteobacteria bacterium]
MRKYFLLSAVALMISGTANATTDYAEVTAKATIEVAGTFTCEDLDFGTIVVKQNNSVMSLVAPGSTSESLPEGIISVSGSGVAMCDGTSFSDGKISLDLKNENNQTMNLLVDKVAGDTLVGTLTIPTEVKAGTYTGSFTVTQTY